MINNSQIINKFISSAVSAGAAVEEIISSPEELSNALLNIISGSKSIVMSKPQYISESLFELFMKNAATVRQPDAGQLCSAEFGISDAFAGVARTGSVCISIDSGLGSYVSLLPQSHIVVLESKNIVARPRDVFDLHILNQPIEKRGWIFISGPSATADMGELVRGAHGPGKLYIILLKD